MPGVRREGRSASVQDYDRRIVGAQGSCRTYIDRLAPNTGRSCTVVEPRGHVMTLRLAEIHALAHRFVPHVAADKRLFTNSHRSWWPAHEIGHFLVATAEECRQHQFGIDGGTSLSGTKRYRYVIARELAATSISQRLLRRSGHKSLADEEIQYTAEDTLECAFESWCRRSVQKLLRTNKASRLPTTRVGLEVRLMHKACAVGTASPPSNRAPNVELNHAHACAFCSETYDLTAFHQCPECAQAPWWSTMDVCLHPWNFE